MASYLREDHQKKVGDGGGEARPPFLMGFPEPGGLLDPNNRRILIFSFGTIRRSNGLRVPGGPNQGNKTRHGAHKPLHNEFRENPGPLSTNFGDDPKLSQVRPLDKRPERNPDLQ